MITELAKHHIRMSCVSLFTGLDSCMWLHGCRSACMIKKTVRDKVLGQRSKPNKRKANCVKGLLRLIAHVLQIPINDYYASVDVYHSTDKHSVCLALVDLRASS